MWSAPQTIPELLKNNVNDFPDREAFVAVSRETGEWLRHTWKEICYVKTVAYAWPQITTL